MNTDRRFWTGIIIFSLVIGIICFFPYWFTTRSFHNLDFSQTGQVGDTIGGIMGPFIAIAAALLTFFAFWVQYQANIQQREQFSLSLKKQKEESLAQEKIWRIERFENRFYELLKLHRANVDEMNIANKLHGRKCFVQMFYELKYCWIKVNDVINSLPQQVKDDHNYHKMNVFEFVYKVFFFGIGFNSEKQLMYSFNQPQMHLFGEYKPVLAEVQDRFEKLRKDNPDESMHVLEIPLSGIADDRTYETSYFPFDGHVNRLGHYYRHLFQTATYVVEQYDEFLDYDMKYSYLKTLRAQLSNHEQLLLYYNSLAWFDDEWREILTKYRFIKNLPLPLANFGVAPEEHFKKEIQELRERGLEMFEWRE